jgi:hypothetical protein
MHDLINNDYKIQAEYKKIRPEYKKLRQKRRNLELESKDMENYEEIRSYYKKFKTVKLNLKRELAQICKEKGLKIFTKDGNFFSDICFKSKLKANQNYHYDLLVSITRKKVILYEAKLEYKYGQDSVSKHPQFFTPHSHDQNEKTLFNKNIVKYHVDFFNKINKFIEEFPPDIQIQLKNECPKTLKEYEQIVNNFNSKEIWQSNFQQTIYNYRKIQENERDDDFEEHAKYNKRGDVAGLCFQNWINQHIENYLKHKTIDDINFDDFRQRILDSQKNKIFLLCKNGTFTHEEIDDKIDIIKEGFKIKGRNLIFRTTNPKYRINMLLRWKNTHGCGKPAYQISLKDIKS